VKALFLRGLTREIRHWNGFPERFEKKTGIPVISMDLPGAGTHAHLTSPRKIEGYIEFLRAQITPGEKILLVGISMGGMIALKWAELYPDEVHSVYAINCSCKNLSKSKERFNLSKWKTILKILLTSDIQMKERLTLEITTNLLSSAEFEVITQNFMRIQQKAPVSKMSAINQLLAARGFQIHGPINVPVTIITGSGDQLVDTQCSLKLAELLKAKLEVHPYAGHDLALDDPSWLLDIFLQLRKSSIA
jgi:pimeloyl-[acyl-carrier protein] methyl ester esterase